MVQIYLAKATIAQNLAYQHVTNNSVALTFLKRGERLGGQPEAPHVRHVLVELVGGHAVAVQVAVVMVVVSDDVTVAQRREHELRAERVAEQVGQVLHCGQQLVRLDGSVRARIPATRKSNPFTHTFIHFS